MRKDAVAVGFGFGDQRRSERAAGAGAVFDHDGLAEIGGKAFEHQPRHDIGGAAGAERYRRLDQPRGPVFGLRAVAARRVAKNRERMDRLTHSGFFSGREEAAGAGALQEPFRR